MIIRKYQESDWKQLWPIIETVFRSGETYPYSPDTTKQEARVIWTKSPQETYVSFGEDNEILGSYYIKPNQAELGSHVCNCGYIVAKNARGKGVASSMCEHSQQCAKDLGFKAMQYNLVVSTNVGAIYLWKKHGFHTVGTLPKAFKSKSLGYVDALVMFKIFETS